MKKHAHIIWKLLYIGSNDEVIFQTRISRESHWLWFRSWNRRIAANQGRLFITWSWFAICFVDSTLKLNNSCAREQGGGWSTICVHGYVHDSQIRGNSKLGQVKRDHSRGGFGTLTFPGFIVASIEKIALVVIKNHPVLLHLIPTSKLRVMLKSKRIWILHEWDEPMLLLQP